MPSAAANCRYAAFRQLVPNCPSAEARRLKVKNGRRKALGMQIRGSFVRGRTVASTLARRGLPMSLRHWCYTERAAQMSSTTPSPVITSHNTCGQLSGLEFPASGWFWRRVIRPTMLSPHLTLGA